MRWISTGDFYFKMNKHFPTKGLSHEQIKEYFIKVFTDKFGSKFDYSLIKDLKSSTYPIKIICKNHGIVNTTSLQHRSLSTGCAECGKSQCHKTKTFTNEFFIKEVDKKYPNRTWKVIDGYKRLKDHVTIEDEDGFLHYILASTVLKVKDSISVKSAIDKTNYTINKFKKVHGDRYDYSRFIYNGVCNRCIIICNKHGQFNTRPTDHLTGKGCRKCYEDIRGECLRSNTGEFIEKAKAIHGEKYNYDKVVYEDAKRKVVITCTTHGDFLQKPNGHLSGEGCNKCVVNGYKRPEYVTVSKGKRTCVYLLRLKNNEEILYKVGVTYKGIDQRFRRAMPYEYEILAEDYTDAGNAWDIERLVLRTFHKFKYKPLIDFQGWTECFNTKLPVRKVKRLIRDNIFKIKL